MTSSTLTVYLRQHCHLCEHMLQELEPWCAGHGLTVDPVDVDSDPVLAARFGEQVPVLADGDRVLCEFRLDEAVLARHLGVAGPGQALREAGAYERIYALVRLIPEGRVATYGQLAAMEGKATARMAGYAMAALPFASDVPWQRVINARGEVSERSGGGGTSRQRQLLEEEGVYFDARGRVDLGRAGWQGPDPAWLARHGFRASPPPGCGAAPHVAPEGAVSHALVMNAACFAARRHRDQRRKGEGQTPYINHPLRVADLLCAVGAVDDPEIIAAGLLHDTVEDTDTEPSEIASRFGERVRDMVLEVSDDKGLTVRERKEAQIAHAASLSRGAALVKVADKIANIEDIVNAPPLGWSVARRRDYLDWAQAVVDSCPRESEALDALFRDTLGRARGALRDLDGP